MASELETMRQLAKEIATGSRSGSSVSRPTAEGLLHVLKAKTAFKNLSKSTDEHKDETSRGKAQLEQADLQLQNLLYEKQYYEKEIRGCLSSRSAVSDEQIALQTVEEFWESADDDLKAKASAQNTDHELTLQRLAHETRVRKKMVKGLDGLKAKKNHLLKTVTDQQKTLKELQSSLKTVGESAKPLQASLSGYPLLKSSRQADLLPLPLYVLFSQLSAGKEALELQITVAIVGAQDEAESLARHASEVQDSAEQAGTSDHDNMNNKRPRLDGDLYKEHPLKIELELASSAPSGTSTKALMSVQFQYLMSLKVITAVCTSPADNQLLASLFPTDDGCTMPSESLLHLEGGTFKFDPKRAARPYRWCQHLGGLDFIPTLPLATQLQSHPDRPAVLDSLETYRRQQRAVTLVSRLRSLKEAAASLNTILANMLKSPVPQDISMYPRHPSCMVLVWEDVTSKTSALISPSSRASATKTVAAPVASSAIVYTPKAPLPGGAGAPIVTPPLGYRLPLAVAVTNVGFPPIKEVAADSALEEGETALPEGVNAHEDGEREGEAEDGTYSEAMVMMPDTPAAGAPNLAAAYWAGHEDGIATASAGVSTSVPKPAYRLYRCVLRSRVGGLLELESQVCVFLDYPSRPPLVRITSLREPPIPAAPGAAKGPPKQLLPRAENHALWMETEANLAVLQLIPESKAKDTLLYQITHLRLCFDCFASQHAMATAAALGPKDLDVWALVKERQRLRGRDRRPPSVALPPLS